MLDWIIYNVTYIYFIVFFQQFPHVPNLNI
ncbi:Uncharacterised protein [Klebsiella pneumoniae]|nr:Uncharacterised protein [Klebsiella pneumoniae]